MREYGYISGLSGALYWPSCFLNFDEWQRTYGGLHIRRESYFWKEQNGPSLFLETVERRIFVWWRVESEWPRWIYLTDLDDCLFFGKQSCLLKYKNDKTKKGMKPEGFTNFHQAKTTLQPNKAKTSRSVKEYIDKSCGVGKTVYVSLIVNLEST